MTKNKTNPELYAETELDINDLESILGGKMYVQGSHIVLEGTANDGRYYKLFFINNEMGLESAYRAAKLTGISTESEDQENV